MNETGQLLPVDQRRLVRQFGEVWVASQDGMAAIGATRKDALAGLADCSHNYQTKMKTSTRGDSPLSGTACYASFWGKILRKWDWWIYRKACGSLRRITLDNPGMSYLMELNIRGWNKQLEISPELKRATEAFHDSMRDHSQHNDEMTSPHPNQKQP